MPPTFTQRSVITTTDGSTTLKLDNSRECYHSTNGAVTESLHIFINCGLMFFIANRIPNSDSVKVTEAGLGTGLNCLLTVLESIELPETQFNYIAIEKYPLINDEVEQLNYASYTGKAGADQLFKKIHDAPWERPVQITGNFTLTKLNSDINMITDNRLAGFIKETNVVYYDAFSPEIQPELWTEDIFKSLAGCMNPGSVLATYSSKGIVKNALREAGFEVKRLKGPEGKKHIVRAIKI